MGLIYVLCRHSASALSALLLCGSLACAAADENVTEEQSPPKVCGNLLQFPSSQATDASAVPKSPSELSGIVIQFADRFAQHKGPSLNSAQQVTSSADLTNALQSRKRLSEVLLMGMRALIRTHQLKKQGDLAHSKDEEVAHLQAKVVELRQEFIVNLPVLSHPQLEAALDVEQTKMLRRVFSEFALSYAISRNPLFAEVAAGLNFSWKDISDYDQRVVTQFTPPNALPSAQQVHEEFEYPVLARRSDSEWNEFSTKINEDVTFVTEALSSLQTTFLSPHLDAILSNPETRKSFQETYVLIDSLLSQITRAVATLRKIAQATLPPSDGQWTMVLSKHEQALDLLRNSTFDILRQHEPQLENPPGDQRFWPQSSRLSNLPKYIEDLENGRAQVHARSN